MRRTFSKTERLCGYELIRSLFKNGFVFYLSPFRVTWMRAPIEDSGAVRVLLSVPKHNLRKAVDRNRVRRCMKESYRRNKHLLYIPLHENQQQLLLCITYTAKEILPQDEIRNKIIVLLHRLLKENEKVTC